MKKYVRLFLTTASLSLALQFGLSSMAYPQQAFDQRLTYSIKFTLQGYNIPFKNKNFSLKNIGGALGVDYSYNSSQTVFQTFTLGLFHNKEHGNNYYLNTQVTYRPVVFSRLEPGISIGIGRILSFSHKSNPYYKLEPGGWTKTHKQSTGRWQVPIALNAGYNITGPNGSRITPFIGYEGAAIIKYNNAFPVLPYTLISVGSRIRFDNH